MDVIYRYKDLQQAQCLQGVINNLIQNSKKFDEAWYSTLSTLDKYQHVLLAKVMLKHCAPYYIDNFGYSVSYEYIGRNTVRYVESFIGVNDIVELDIQYCHIKSFLLDHMSYVSVRIPSTTKLIDMML